MVLVCYLSKFINTNSSEFRFGFIFFILFHQSFDAFLVCLEFDICLHNFFYFSHLCYPLYYQRVFLEIVVNDVKHGDVVEGNQVANAGMVSSHKFALEVDLLEIFEGNADYFFSELSVESGISSSNNWCETKMKDKEGAFPCIEMVEIKKLIYFSLLGDVFPREPLFSHIEFLGQVFQNGMTFCHHKSILSVLDSRHSSHRVDLSKLFGAGLNYQSCTPPVSKGT